MARINELSPAGYAGTAFSLAFRAIKTVRPVRPIHPEGVGLTGVLERHGPLEGSGIPWIDTAGSQSVTARLSRSVGLPAGSPDILGLAFRIHSDAGDTDLLLATTGTSRAGRFILLPRRLASDATFSSLMPYQGAAGPVLLAARTVGAHCQLPADPTAFRRALGQGSWTLGLCFASPLGTWKRFATVKLALAREGAVEPIRFDPVLSPLPGAGTYAWTRRLREPSYAAARTGPPAASL